MKNCIRFSLMAVMFTLLITDCGSANTPTSFATEEINPTEAKAKVTDTPSPTETPEPTETRPRPPHCKEGVWV